MTQNDLRTATQVIAHQVKKFRLERGWTAQELADRLAEAGMPHMKRPVITNLEIGRRQTVTVEEVLTLAWVLDVPPLMMFLPLGLSDEFEITPNTAVHPGLALKWILGEEVAPTSDRKMAAHTNPSLHSKAGQPLRLYQRLTEAQAPVSRAEMDMEWAKDPLDKERLRAAEDRRDEALAELAKVLDAMLDAGVLPPAIWHERYTRMRELRLLKRPEAIRSLTEDDQED